MKIGLLGGSFDPAHIGHLHLAKFALQKLGLDQIWIIPTAQNPLKKTAQDSYQKRLQNCREFFSSHPKIFVKNHKENSVATFDLVEKLQAQNPRATFIWIAGGDIMRDLHRWKNFPKLAKKIEFAIFLRDKFLLKARQSKAFIMLERGGVRPCRAKIRALPKISFYRQKNCPISSSFLRNP